MRHDPESVEVALSLREDKWSSLPPVGFDVDGIV